MVDLRAEGAKVNRICAAKVDHIRAECAKVNLVRSTILLLENHKDIETDRSDQVAKPLQGGGATHSSSGLYFKMFGHLLAA